MKHNAVNVVGWLGVIAIVLAYGLNIAGVVAVSSYVYLLLNGLGAVALIWESSTKKDWQSVVLNIVWALIAIYGVLSAL